MSISILLVQNDPDTIEILQPHLALQGYQVQVATDGLEALRLFTKLRPDLVILEVMLPKVDGREVCRLIRSESWKPIIMLTAQMEESSLLSCLDLGADDYITKPFNPKEVVARVKAVSRRANSQLLNKSTEQLECGGIYLDLKDYQARVNGEPVWLTPTEVKLLVMFMREPRRVFTREQVTEKVLGREFDGYDRAVDSHISNLRRKLNGSCRGPRYVKSIYGVGYKLIDD